MQIESALTKLQALTDTKFAKGLHEQKIREFLAKNKLMLPESHINLLRITNGIESYGGYFRILGINVDPALDLAQWNAETLWRFAWQGLLDGFICFAETAFGDQYAYKVSELAEGKPQVYFIEGVAMTKEVIAENFEDFFINEFFENAKNPYDEMLIAARKKVGDLKGNENVTYNPSPLICGQESIDNIQKLDKVTAMIFNGDLLCQLEDTSHEQQINQIAQYIDENNRIRLKIVW